MVPGSIEEMRFPNPISDASTAGWQYSRIISALGVLVMVIVPRAGWWEGPSELHSGFVQRLTSLLSRIKDQIQIHRR